MREGFSRKAKNDIILILSLVLLVLVAGAALLLFKSDGDAVIVSVDGEVIAEYPLSEDIEVEIKSDGGYNILIIEDGKARVESASCPDPRKAMLIRYYDNYLQSKCHNLHLANYHLFYYDVILLLLPLLIMYNFFNGMVLTFVLPCSLFGKHREIHFKFCL